MEVCVSVVQGTTKRSCCNGCEWLHGVCCLTLFNVSGSVWLTLHFYVVGCQLLIVACGSASPPNSAAAAAVLSEMKRQGLPLTVSHFNRYHVFVFTLCCCHSTASLFCSGSSTCVKTPRHGAVPWLCTRFVLLSSRCFVAVL